ncbi:cobalt-precorrin-6A reductase [Pararhizobium mangrovi]|uniref:Cobalt-precorrin-6A reductase n=1 Tax=Pararhizobium mangrovi TaxID=2590452 RepID=A0A506UEJ2_9HYPH|nr:cobalt-precorrin-6A reductase [Pararhizobium mangrovi]TPW31295.1 cobalt-precorrin-6A reductase [Pararhizobium mangrovi]
MRPRTVLILGGTREAFELAERLAPHAGMRVVTALAGRTRSPMRPAGEIRIGGFGGSTGLATYLRAEAVDMLVDATHPFAARISENAQKAAATTGTRRVVLVRPPWHPHDEDDWRPCARVEAAAQALPNGARAFLALGSQHLVPFAARKDCFFVVRMIDPPSEALPPENHTLVLARPGRDPNDEMRLFTEHTVSHLVCRNSGGKGAHAKLEAARHLRLPVLMIDRPPCPDGETFTDVDALVAAIA